MSAESNVGGSFAAAKEFLETHSVALRAAHPLKRDAEVRIYLTDEPGQEFRFFIQDGKPHFERAPAHDPDFTAHIPPGAVVELGKLQGDAGDFGIGFFKLMLADEPERHVKVRLHSGFIKLTRRGYLGVLATGGAKILGWLATRGLRGPFAVADAIKKLRRQ